MTYRRRYFAQPQWPTVLDLLLTDETNPRSLLFQINALAEHAARLPRPTGRRRLAWAGRGAAWGPGYRVEWAACACCRRTAEFIRLAHSSLFRSCHSPGELRLLPNRSDDLELSSTACITTSFIGRLM